MHARKPANGFRRLAPRWNPFDAIHNRLYPDRFQLQGAPPPRRFAQALAGAMAASVAALLLLRFRLVATIIAAILLAAVGGILFRGFCLGSYVFNVLSSSSRRRRPPLTETP